MKEGFRYLKRRTEREKFYPGPVLEPGPLAVRASALPLRHSGQLPMQGRIDLFEPILPWIGTCPGWRSGSALARKARGPGSSPGPG